jgi:hypothetical protein
LRIVHQRGKIIQRPDEHDRQSAERERDESDLPLAPATRMQVGRLVGRTAGTKCLWASRHLSCRLRSSFYNAHKRGCFRATSDQRLPNTKREEWTEKERTWRRTACRPLSLVAARPGWLRHAFA